MSSDHPSRGGRWSELAWQVPAIALAILLAFGIDRAWELRGERQREAAYIDRLRSDFAASREEIDDDIAARAAQLAEVAALMRALGAAESVPPQTMARVVAGPLLTHRFYIARHASYDELVATGSLHLLRSRGLREALLTYDQERQRLSVQEGFDREVRSRIFMPWARDRVDLLPAVPAGDAAGIGLAPGSAASVHDIDPRELGNVLYMRWRSLSNTQLYAQHVREAVGEIERLLAEPGIP
jgi:hypothetical protein